jgi:gamma-glutamyltranspeptidase
LPFLEFFNLQLQTLIFFGLYRLGGGGYALIRNPEGKTSFLDFRETAPAAATFDMFKNSKNSKEKPSQRGGKAVATPGEISGLWELHMGRGNLEWATLFEPAIKLAREGFKITPEVSEYLEDENFNFLYEGNWKEVFAPEGDRKVVGDMIFRKKYADTLETLSKEPRDMYNGVIAKRLIETIQANQGIMTLDDLKGYQPRWRKVYTANFGSYKVHVGGLSTIGMLYGSAISILQKLYHTNKLSRRGEDDTSYNVKKVHYISEVFKFMYAMVCFLLPLLGLSKKLTTCIREAD